VAGCSEDVDPAPVAFPVLEACQATEVLAGSGCRVGVHPLGEPSLSQVALELVERVVASKPEVASPSGGGAHDQAVVLASDRAGGRCGQVVEEDERPDVPPRRPDVDL
jgi:hypothetical protein